MSINNKIKFTGILIGLVLGLFVQSPGQTKDKIDSDIVCIPGTNICLDKPANYTLANKFPGIKNPSSGAFIMISELENSFPVIKKTFTKEKFNEQGMELLNRTILDFGTYEGILYKVSKQTNGIYFGKWIMVLGNDTSSVMINGTFPDKFDTDLSSEVEDCVISAYVNNEIISNPENSVGFRIDVVGTKLKFAKAYSGLLIYTVAGVFPINSLDPVTFKIGSSLGRIKVEEPRDFAIKQLIDLSYNFEKEMNISPIKINDLSGYEIISYGKEKESNDRQIIYQVILFDKESYYLLLGTAYNDFENNLSLFIDVASSFKREIR